MSETKKITKAYALIGSIDNGIRRGVKYCRKSDGQLLTVPSDVVQAMAKEGEVWVVDGKHSYDYSL